MSSWLASLPALPTALTVFTIALWATGKLPEYLTALLFFAIAMILAIAPREVIFSGFSSAAFWLVLSGYVLGIAMTKSGLADRAARQLSRRLTGNYMGLVAGVVLLTYLLAFVMPSNMGRIALLMPIVLLMAERAGLQAGSRGYIGLALAVGFGTYQLSASILPANVPNLVMAGAIEGAYGLRLPYLPYFVLQAPVLGLLKGLIIVACIGTMFRDQPRPAADTGPAQPFSRTEIRLCVLLALTLAGWLTDSWHGVSPAWIGLLAACICLLPRIGFVTAEEFATKVNMRACIYVAGILGLAAMVAFSGLGEKIGTALSAVVPLDPATPFTNFISLVGISSALNFFVTANGLPALFTPLAQSLADATGFPLLTVLMTQVFSFATPLLPYQAGPIVIAIAMGKVPARDGFKLCLVVGLISLVVLAPLLYFWFAALGMFTR